MHPALALCLIALCTTSNASAREHHAMSRHVVAPHKEDAIPRYVTPSGVWIYRDDSAPGGLRTNHDHPPAYDDPSKFGGG